VRVFFGVENQHGTTVFDVEETEKNMVGGH
jgi:hypothetical protein